jgi:hypothetical protein
MLVNHVGSGLQFEGARQFCASTWCRRVRRQEGPTCARWALVVLHEVASGRECSADELAPLVAHCRVQRAPETIAEAVAGSTERLVQVPMTGRSIDARDLAHALVLGPCVVGIKGAYHDRGYQLARVGRRDAHAIVCVAHVLVSGEPTFVFKDSNFRRRGSGDFCLLPRRLVADPSTLPEDEEALYRHLSDAGQLAIDELFYRPMPASVDRPMPDS